MSEATLREIATLLRELLKWSRFAGMQQLKSILTSTLASPQEKLVYELSDGERSTREIASMSGIGHTTVQRYWEKWRKVGIVEPAKREGRFQRICSLEDVGLEMPTPPITQSPAPTQANTEVKSNE